MKNRSGSPCSAALRGRWGLRAHGPYHHHHHRHHDHHHDHHHHDDDHHHHHLTGVENKIVQLQQHTHSVIVTIIIVTIIIVTIINSMQV